jgi:hypothetical protein
MSGSTPQTIIRTPFDMRESGEVKNKKESKAPEFPRKKERKRKK